jgi:hypothetical protein
MRNTAKENHMFNRRTSHNTDFGGIMQQSPKADMIAVEDIVRLNDYKKWLLIDAITELIAEGELPYYGQLQK